MEDRENEGLTEAFHAAAEIEAATPITVGGGLARMSFTNPEWLKRMAESYDGCTSVGGLIVRLNIEEEDEVVAGFNPDWASPPGHTIRQRLEDMGVESPRDFLAEHLGLPVSAVEALLAGNIRITPGLGSALSRLLGSTPRFWAERDRQFWVKVGEFQSLSDRLV